MGMGVWELQLQLEKQTNRHKDNLKSFTVNTRDAPVWFYEADTDILLLMTPEKQYQYEFL